MSHALTIQDFPYQREGETVMIIVRRHWWVLFLYLLTLAFQLLVGVGVVALLLFIGVEITEPRFNQILLVLGGALYVLFVWSFFFHHWVDYYLDVWIVTDERVLNIVQNGLFSRTVSELSIVNIQDVTSELKGKIPTLLDFGDVHIQTAGEKNRFTFDDVANPEGIAARITEIHEAAVYKKDQGSDRSLHDPRSEKSRSVHPVKRL